MNYLRRLPEQAYIGEQLIHWTLCIQDRKTGWLNPETHVLLRESLLHAAIHYEIRVPVYTLMPDHAHFLIAGVARQVNQLHAMAFIRKTSTTLIQHPCFTWQKQAYDHVLKRDELRDDVFRKLVHYVLQNPCRKGLCNREEEWPFSSSMIPGYPDRTWRDPDFWEFYWKLESRRRV